MKRKTMAFNSMGLGADAPAPAAPTLCPAGQTYMPSTVPGAQYTCVTSAGSSTSPCTFALFGETSCFNVPCFLSTLSSCSIGKITAFVLGGAALVFLLPMFGGKK
jgi:hypothetical protein